MFTRKIFNLSDRLLGSFVLVLTVFSITMGWAFVSLRTTAYNASLLREKYVPLLTRIGEVLAEQNVFNAQLNQITATKSAVDIRNWIETVYRTRPLTLKLVKTLAESGVAGSDVELSKISSEIIRDVETMEQSSRFSSDRFSQLYQAISVGNRDEAEKIQNELIKRETDVAQRMRKHKARIEERMETLAEDAKKRESRSIVLLVMLAIATLLVGLMVSVYARRVLAPLVAVTARANAVAAGDLTPRNIVAANDEIGELAHTFEGMVVAIDRARKEMVHSERLATVVKMAARVAHEIRNPLSSINLNLELLQEELEHASSSVEARNLSRSIHRELERLSAISEQYLHLARRNTPRFEEEDVEALVRETLQFLEADFQSDHIAIDLNIIKPILHIACDELQIKQVLFNLFRNAREAIVDNGHIVVTLDQKNDHVVLSVEDNGLGISDDLVNDVFEPFFTTKSGGTGLGLAICKEIVESHNGTITCHRSELGGTKFTIELPLLQNTIASVPPFRHE